eukprot:CAMPEP_0197036472 /NCGR_PEP_ID=MMETSP1384-20130603/13966_1 /TAXON_ID=29189 /ORGANISM="Ammonia sp." /LENGTH=136 /DNA_ID=CAMNT_0042466653 /DNA_START=238 /DNA_END=649 /DNA_ORIENTATION=-
MHTSNGLESGRSAKTIDVDRTQQPHDDKELPRLEGEQPKLATPENFVGWNTDGQTLYAYGGKLANPFYSLDDEGKQTMHDKTCWNKDKRGRELYHGPKGGIYYLTAAGNRVYQKYPDIGRLYGVSEGERDRPGALK